MLTLAAQMTTLPVTAVAFHRFSLSAVLANPLVLPAQPLVMGLGLAALLGGAVFLPLGQALAALNPTVVVWQNVGAFYESPGWLSLAGVDWVELATNGEQVWVELEGR